MNAIEPITVERGDNDALIRVVVALGCYSDEADPDVHSRLHRAKTVIGTLMNQGKYHPESPRTQERACDRIVELLIETATSHPLLAGVQAVVAVPGSNSDFSERIAEDLGRGLELPVIVGRAPVRGGRSAKDHPVKRRYVVDEKLDDMHILLFDDVYESSGSMYALAQAAVEAGASRRSGLVVAQVLQRAGARTNTSPGSDAMPGADA